MRCFLKLCPFLPLLPPRAALRYKRSSCDFKKREYTRCPDKTRLLDKLPSCHRKVFLSSFPVAEGPQSFSKSRKDTSSGRRSSGGGNGGDSGSVKVSEDGDVDPTSVCDRKPTSDGRSSIDFISRLRQSEVGNFKERSSFETEQLL